ncbi:protein S-acyltransferase 10-like isoform X1 [Gossypium australe]|uniref:Protein S-acyltransferase 10-like isoform X1 n=1 Tax=Gossypium australe TaxID=47621 RepID=A0A5B6UL75_9ROSI|nr:protein S-acyltransferase 10-like isoform X1 [Gossypium australe]
MTTVMGICRSFRDRAFSRFFHCSPCLSDPARRSSWGLKVTLVMLHLIFVGILFVFDGDLIEKTKKEPWYTALYLLLLFATLVQYFITSSSSPGYVVDVMRAVNETNVIDQKSSMASKQPASSQNGSLNVVTEGSQSGRNFQGSNPSSWTKLVMDMYPPGTSIRSCTCSYCNVEQIACDCYLCLFVYNCSLHEQSTVMIVINVFFSLIIIVYGSDHVLARIIIANFETALCLWTGILYIMYLKANISRAWWKDAIMILLLIALSISIIFLLLLLLFHSYLVLTNQTTYELVRRRRIPYLRRIPERVYPFSKGICRNLYNFCCVRSSIYSLEPLPSSQELEEKARPYTCLDILTCRCC